MNDNSFTLVIDGSVPTAEIVAMLTAQLQDLAEERLHYDIVTKNETQFLELARNLYDLSEKAREILGTLFWKRLVDLFGREASDISEKRNREAREQVAYWCAKQKLTYEKVQRLVSAAMGRDLHPPIAEMSLTAQHEITANAGDTMAEKEQTIKERAEAVEELDPDKNDTTKTVREVKQAQKAGIDRPMLYRAPDQTGETDYVIHARVLVEERITDDGEMIPVYEYPIVARVDRVQPQAEILREQYAFYHSLIDRRLGVRLIGDDA